MGRAGVKTIRWGCSGCEYAYPQLKGGPRCGLAASNGYKFKGKLIADLSKCPKEEAKQEGTRLVNVTAIDKQKLRAMKGMLELSVKTIDEILTNAEV